MANKKSKKLKLSAEQIADASKKIAELESQLAKAMTILGPSEFEVGRILYSIKRCLIQCGWSKGRNGRWEPLVTKHGMDRKTAENRIRKYQEEARIPANERVVQPASPKEPKGKKSQQDSENNTVKVTGLEQPSVKAAEDKDCDNSDEKRLGIECVFVLTMEEKHKFMGAVQVLGPIRATQAMYKAVVEATPKVAGAPS
jgi:hypothetical protein